MELVDGGDTDQPTQEDIETTYSEPLELYYSLVEKSPNLSIEVMSEAILKVLKFWRYALMEMKGLLKQENGVKDCIRFCWSIKEMLWIKSK